MAVWLLALLLPIFTQLVCSNADDEQFALIEAKLVEQGQAISRLTDEVTNLMCVIQESCQPAENDHHGGVYAYGKNVINRSILDIASHYMVVMKSEGMEADGYISTWRYWAGRTDSNVDLMIWRQTDSSSANFEFVGSISHNPIGEGLQELSARDVGVVSVRAGDFFGIAFSNLNPIPFDDGEHTGCTDRWWGKDDVDVSSLRPGQTHSLFQGGSIPCRDYSFQVEVVPYDW